MNRRRYLAVAGVPFLAEVAGCFDAVGDGNPGGTGGDAEGGTGTGDGTGAETPPGSDTGGAPDPTGDIRIALRNDTSGGVTVRLTVTTDGTAFFEEELGVPPTGSRSVDPGIDEPGRYELEVAVEGGPNETYPFGVERYDLEMGSNLIVVVADDDVRVMIEE